MPLALRPFRAPPFLVLLATALLAACGSDSGPGPSEPEGAHLLEISPESPTLLPGDSVGFGVAIAGDIGDDLLSLIRYRSSNTSVAVVRGDPVTWLVGIAPGTAEITAEIVGPVTPGQPGSLSTMVTVTEGVLAENAVVADGTDLKLTSDSASVAEGILTFENTGNVQVDVGDVLVGSEQNGYVKRVLTKTTSGNTLTVTTEQASLADAVSDLVMDVTNEFSLEEAFEELRAAGGQVEGIYLPEGVELREGGEIGFQGISLGGILSGPVGNGRVDVTTDASVDVLFGSAARPGASALEIDGKIGISGVERFLLKSTARVVLSGSATARVTGNPQGSTSARLESPSALTPSFVLTKRADGQRGTECRLIGPVPFCYKVTLLLPFYAQITTTVAGTFQQGVTYDRGVTAGGEFKNGQWQGIFEEFGPGLTVQGVGQQQGSVALRFGVVPQVQITLYEVAGPFVGIDTWMQLAAGVEPYHWWADVKLGIDLAVGLRVTILDQTLAEVSYNHPLATWTLAEAQGALAKLVVSPDPAQVGIGRTRQMSVAAYRLLDNAMLPTPTNVEWATGDGGVATVDGQGRVRGVGNGTTVAAAKIAHTPVVSETVDVVSGPVHLPVLRLDATHVYAVTECPQLLPPIPMENVVDEAVSWSASVSSDLLEYDGGFLNASGTLQAGASREFRVYFTCGIDQTFEESLNIRVTRGQQVMEFEVPIRVNVVHH